MIARCREELHQCAPSSPVIPDPALLFLPLLQLTPPLDFGGSPVAYYTVDMAVGESLPRTYATAFSGMGPPGMENQVTLFGLNSSTMWVPPPGPLVASPPLL